MSTFNESSLLTADDVNFNLGDPSDKTLKSFENELIDKKMKEIARNEKCFEERKKFADCCTVGTMLNIDSCLKEQLALNNCIKNWCNNEQFRETCTNQYLETRTEYRRTGNRKQ